MAAPRDQQVSSESIRLLGAALDRLAESIAVLDEDGRIVVVNRAWIDFGRTNGAASDEQWIGVDYLAACHDSEWQWLQGAREACAGVRAVLAGAKEEIEMVYPWHGPHEKRWFRMRASGFNHAGARWAMVTYTNISDVKHFSEVVTTSHLHYRNLVDNALTGVINTTFDGEITFVNQALARMLEFDSPQEMLAEGTLPLWRYPEHRQKFLSELKQHGHVENYEMDAVTKTGKIIHTLISATLHSDEISGMVIDITERKQAQDHIKAHESRLKALASQLTFAEERERRRVALELHDHMVQSLAVMRMQLAAAKKESTGQKVAAILDEVSDSVRQALQDTRNVISDLSAPLTKEIDLSAAISEWLREQVEERYGLASRFNDDGEPKPLDEDTKAVLFRSVRELLINAVKHAKASRVTVGLQRKGSTVQIVVEDDGVGLARDQLPEKKTGEGGFGLFSIKERMTDIGGSFEIESSPGQGVRAILSAPLEPE